PIPPNGLPVVTWGPSEPGLGWLPTGAPPDALRACVEALASAGEAMRLATEARRHDEAMRELVHVLVTVTGAPDLLYDVSCVIAGALAADRASVYLCAEDQETLYVVGASDDPAITKLALSMSKYPEVRAALESRSTLYLEDASNSELLAGVRAQVRA